MGENDVYVGSSFVSKSSGRGCWYWREAMHVLRQGAYGKSLYLPLSINVNPKNCYEKVSVREKNLKVIKKKKKKLSFFSKPTSTTFLTETVNGFWNSCPH